MYWSNTAVAPPMTAEGIRQAAEMMLRDYLQRSPLTQDTVNPVALQVYRELHPEGK